MKKTITFFRLLPVMMLAVLMLVGNGSVIGQSLLVDDFTGLTTGNLAGQSSWTKGGTGPDATVANTTPLTYQGYNGGGGEYVIMPTSTSTTGKVTLMRLI